MFKNTITIINKDFNPINSESDTILISSPYNNQERRRNKREMATEKRSTQLRNKSIKKPKSTLILPMHNYSDHDEEWHCIVCDAHIRKALLVNLVSNAKVVSVHMTNASLLFNTLFVQI